MFTSTVGIFGLSFFIGAGFVVVVFSASEADDWVGAAGGYVVELLALETLFDGGWGAGLLHSVLEEVHIEAFMEKASRLIGVSQVDLDECSWLLGGFTCDTVKFYDVDALFFQFFSDLFFCDAGVYSFDDQDFGWGFRWGGGALFA